MVEPHVRQKTVVLSLHQLDIHTLWCTHRTQIASHAASTALPLRQSDAIVLRQRRLDALVFKPCRLRAAVSLGFGNRVDQKEKVDLQLLGRIHFPTLWPPMDYHLRASWAS